MSETSSQLLNYASVAVLVGIVVLCILHYKLDQRQKTGAQDSEYDE